MRKRSSGKLIWSALVLAGACSTTEIQSVEMQAFTKSMEQNLKIVDSRLAGIDLPALIADDRRAQLVEKSGYYELEDCIVEPSALLTDPEDISAPYFDERCKLNAKDKNAEEVAFDMAPGLDRAVAAQRTSADLKAYMAAISDLGASDQPTRVAGQLAASLGALNNLAESAAAFGGRKIDKDVTNTIKAGSTLAETLAREGLETMRYRALAAILRDADPAVYAACIQLALWLAQDEDQAMRDDLDALADAEDEATRFAAFGSDGGAAHRETLAAKLRAVEDRYAALAKRDRAAKWRVFLSAAQAHRALRDAFDRPADIQAAAKAHARLDTLVEQTLAVAEAAGNP